MKDDKVVDSVEMMRQIREKMTIEMQEMSFEERSLYIKVRARRIVKKPHLQKMQGAA